MKVVYYSLTGNTESFAHRFPNSLTLEQAQYMTEPYVLFTPTYNFGEVPEPVCEFLDHNEDYLRGVVAFGNRNWGAKFAQAGDLIAEVCGVPLLRKVEMRGTDGDFAEVMAILSQNAREEK